jgi:hypothetical protein
MFSCASFVAYIGAADRFVYATMAVTEFVCWAFHLIQLAPAYRSSFCARIPACMVTLQPPHAAAPTAAPTTARSPSASARPDTAVKAAGPSTVIRVLPSSRHNPVLVNGKLFTKDPPVPLPYDLLNASQVEAISLWYKPRFARACPPLRWCGDDDTHICVQITGWVC